MYKLMTNNIFLKLKTYIFQKRVRLGMLLANASKCQTYVRAFCNIYVFNFKKILFVISLCPFLTTNCGFIESRAFKSSYEKKNCEEAKSILLNALKKNSDNIDANYNLVHTFVCSGDLVAARKQIDSLIASKSPYLFELYFLKGYILGEIGEIDDALMAYQMALDLKNDPRIKENMELLLKDRKSGKSGKKKKGKGQKQKNSETDKNSEDDQDDPEQKNENPNPNKPNDKDPKDDNSKKMSQKQTEQIMKEIDGEEKKVRSQGLKIKSQKGGAQNDKNW